MQISSSHLPGAQPLTRTCGNTAAPKAAPQACESFESGIPPEAQVCPQFFFGHTSQVQAPIAAASPSELKQAARAVNNFSFDLFRRLGEEKKGESFFASPFNVNGCLGMVLAGARGETEASLAKGLRCEDLKGDRVHAGIAALNSSAVTRGDGVNISIANRVFADNNFQVESGFKNVTEQTYGAEARNLAIVADSEGSRQTINGQIEADTNGKIKDLLPEGALTSDSVMVLTSAIHFKGDWKAAFDKNNTYAERFAGSKGGEVDMMHQTGDFKFATMKFDGSRANRWDGDGDFSAIELPYKNERFSMVAMVPVGDRKLEELEAHLNADTLDNIGSKMTKGEVDVALPKFKTESDFSLKPALQKMGMENLFAGADLSGINKEADLCVSDVFHKANMEVNEEGSEFAAATGAVIALECVRMSDEFKADRPFLYMVKDNESGAVLCTGRVANP